MTKFSIRAFAIAFVSSFLIFILFWMAVLLWGHPKSSSEVFSQPKEIPSGQVYLPEESDAMTLLICSDSSSPRLFFLLRFSPLKGHIFITSLPSAASLERTSPSLSLIYQQQGIRGIQDAFATSLDIPIHHYLKVSLSQLPSMLDYFSPTKAALEKDLSVNLHGTAVILKKGLQELPAQQLIQWILSRQPKELHQQGIFFCQALAYCINQHRELLYLENSAPLFMQAVNHFDSDLHYSDYDCRKQAADFLGRISPQPAQVLSLELESSVGPRPHLSEKSCQLLQENFS